MSKSGYYFGDVPTQNEMIPQPLSLLYNMYSEWWGRKLNEKVPDCTLKSLNTNWLCSELLIVEQRLTSFNKFKGCKCHVFRHGKERIGNGAISMYF